MVDEHIHYLPMFFQRFGQPVTRQNNLPGTVRRDFRRWQDMTSQRLRQVLHLLMEEIWREFTTWGCTKPYEEWDIYFISTSDFFLWRVCHRIVPYEEYVILCIVEVFLPGLKLEDVTWSWESSFCHSFSFVGSGQFVLGLDMQCSDVS